VSFILCRRHRCRTAAHGEVPSESLSLSWFSDRDYEPAGAMLRTRPATRISIRIRRWTRKSATGFRVGTGCRPSSHCRTSSTRFSAFTTVRSDIRFSASITGAPFLLAGAGHCSVGSHNNRVMRHFFATVIVSVCFSEQCAFALWQVPKGHQQAHQLHKSSSWRCLP
jgi:hypothetical protein